MATKRQHELRALVGGEPNSAVLDPTSSNYTSDFIGLTNWYSYEKGKKDAYKYHTEYIKKHRPQDQKMFMVVEESDIINTFGWMCRIVNRGGKLSEDHQIRLSNYLDNLIELGKGRVRANSAAASPINAPKQNVIFIQEATLLKAQEFVGELEADMDEVYFGDKEINLYNLMKARQIPAAYVNEVRSWASDKLTQFTEVSEGNDPQLREGYSNFNKRKITALVKLFASFVEDCDKYTTFKKANRKPRMVKEKTPSQQVKSIKYKVEDTELNLKSSPPAEMIGASQVWLYNTKTKKLSKYVSDSTKGIQAKGSAIQNWDPEQSKQKTLRKPAETIKLLMESGKIKLRTLLEDIKTKEQSVNGRINIDTIILKILR